MSPLPVPLMIVGSKYDLYQVSFELGFHLLFTFMGFMAVYSNTVSFKNLVLEMTARPLRSVICST